MTSGKRKAFPPQSQWNTAERLINPAVKPRKKEKTPCIPSNTKHKMLNFPERMPPPTLSRLRQLGLTFDFSSIICCCCGCCCCYYCRGSSSSLCRLTLFRSTCNKVCYNLPAELDSTTHKNAFIAWELLAHNQNNKYLGRNSERYIMR